MTQTDRLKFAFRLDSHPETDSTSNVVEGGSLQPYDADAPLHVLKDIYRRDMTRLGLTVSAVLGRAFPAQSELPLPWMSEGFWYAGDERHLPGGRFLRGYVDEAEFVTREEAIMALDSGETEIRVVFDAPLPTEVLEHFDLYQVVGA